MALPPLLPSQISALESFFNTTRMYGSLPDDNVCTKLSLALSRLERKRPVRKEEVVVWLREREREREGGGREGEKEERNESGGEERGGEREREHRDLVQSPSLLPQSL